jgi:tRNA 2-selenouridine synthase
MHKAANGVTVFEADSFLEQARSTPVIDVRAPVEYARGHIPGAHNICLFTDEERAEIGTLYHQQSRDVAFSRGLEIVSPKLALLVKKAEAFCPEKKVLLYCFRGGLRSNNFASLLMAAGFEVGLLKGGYKAFRTHIHQAFEAEQRVIVLGGMTGSGKTEVLKQLPELGIRVIDLEGLAHHKGSVFGAIGETQQPSSEHFENLLFTEWSRLSNEAPVILEDENMDIGTVKMPVPIYRKIRTSPLIVMNVPTKIRVQRLVAQYSGNDDDLRTAIRRIERRLGNERMNQALAYIENKEHDKAAAILLIYYDESYLAGIQKRDPQTLVPIDCADTPPDAWPTRIANTIHTHPLLNS